MAIDLTPDTQQRLTERMATRGHATLDETVNSLLDETAEEAGVWDELDPETQAAIAEGEAQADRGEARPLAEVREELRRQFGVDKL